MVGVVAAVVVGATFVVSGVAKLARPALWRTQSSELVAPLPALSIVPYAELVLGAGLLVQWHRALWAAAAIVALVSFTTVIIVRLGQGRRPPCACFGVLTATPIGWRHVVRNAGLIALAVVALLI